VHNSHSLHPKKVVYQTHSITFLILNIYFKILPSLERELNFQQKPHNTSQQTFSVLPHYLAKVKSLNFGKSGRKCQQKCNMQHLLSFHQICGHRTVLILTQ